MNNQLVTKSIQFFKKHYFDLLTICIVLFFLARQFPVFVQNWQSQGSVFSNQALHITLQQSILTSTNQQIRAFERKETTLNNLLKVKSKKILVFWASWCGPCKIELSRLKKIADSKNISSDHIIMVSIGDLIEDSEKEYHEQKYNFTLVNDVNSQLADLLQIQSTPTIIFVDENLNIQWRASGLSPSLEFRVSNFIVKSN